MTAAAEEDGELKPDTYGLFTGVDDDARKVAFNLFRRGWSTSEVQRAASLKPKIAESFAREFFDQKERTR